MTQPTAGNILQNYKSSTILFLTYRSMERRGQYTPQPEFTQQKRDEVLKRLEAAVEQIQDSDDFRAWLGLQSRFHQYSYGNTLLIMAQRPTATRVAGLRTWNALGRFVNKGERGIDILAPVFPKGTTKEQDEQQVPVNYIVVKTFDVSQTNGKPLPEFDVPVLEGDEGGVLDAALEQLAIGDGLRVERPRHLLGDEMGLYAPDGKLIVVRTHDKAGQPVSQLQQTKTMAHELAHHVGGHGRLQTGTMTRTRGEEESIAEACAYVTLAHFGLDSGARSFPYIAGWAHEKEVLQGVMGDVQRVSARLIAGAEKLLGIGNEPAHGGGDTR